MRRGTLVGFLVMVACSPEDPAVRTRGSGIFETNHVVKLRSLDGAAHLEVTREYRNDGDEAHGLIRPLEVPDGAIATSLRLSRGTDAPLRAPLLTEEQVTSAWDELTGFGEAEPMPIGKLEWAGDDTLMLSLFGVPPHETVTVGYDLQVEPAYAAGVQTFTYPHQEAGMTPRFERADVEETEDGFVVRRQVFTDTVADVRWATLQLDTDRTLYRLEIDAAPELGATPRAPWVVFVVDASHSEGPEGIAAQLELLAPYLANVPDARVEVVVTRRRAERLFGSFVSASDVPARLVAAADRLIPGNGSNLDDGLGVAARALAGVSTGPSRILVLTDERLRASFSVERALEQLAVAPRDTVVHVVERTANGADHGPLEVTRRGETTLSPLTDASGGITVHARGTAGSGDATRAMLELVRPTRLEDFTVEAEGLELTVDPQLEEGSMVRLHGIDAAPPAFVTVKGKLWTKPITKVVGVDSFLAERLPAQAIGEPTFRADLRDDELRSAAFLARAVSPVTSFLATPPGAAPSRSGIWMHGFGHEFGMLGGKRWVSTHCTMGGATPQPRLLDHLRALLTAGVSACEASVGEAAIATLRIEVTGDEVVDVGVSRASPAMSACLTEAAWSIRLGPEFRVARVLELVLGE